MIRPKRLSNNMISEQRQSPKYPILVVVIGFIIGILLAEIKFISIWVCLILICICIVLSFIRNKYVSLIAIIGLFIGVGSLYAYNHLCLTPDHITSVMKYYKQKPALVRGVIVSDISEREIFQTKKYTFILNVKEVYAPWGWKTKSGKVLVQIFRNEHLRYGDGIEVEGRLHKPYDFQSDSRFSYSKYLRNYGIRAMLSVKNSGKIQVLSSGNGVYIRAEMLKVRSFFRNILVRYLSKNEAGIMQAILLGERGYIPKHIRELFTRTGSAHILAISGLHVGVIAGIFLLIVRLLPLPRNFQFFIVIILLWLYVMLTGGRPSVLRASLMMSVLFIGGMLEKEADAINTLGLAALVILLVNPLYIFDIGFQLSFVCVLGILLGGFPIELAMTRVFLRKHWWISATSISISVWIAAAGLVLYHFYIIVPITVLTNFWVIPFLGIIVALGFMLLLFGAFLPIIAPFVAVCLKGILNVLAGGLFFFNKIPGAYILFKDVSVWYIIVYYIIIIILLLIYYRFVHKTQLDRSLFDKAGQLS